jgi:4-hydroxythreonine-4-phosphate dehydrogenase
VTGPISKENLQAAGIPYSGHTEILQYLARKAYQQPYQSDMLFLYEQFRMLLLTRHVALRKVSETLSIKGVVQSLGNLSVFLQNHCGINKPRLCVLGVNPHAGELDGDEEERVLKPALKLTSAKYGYPIQPPVAADAAFRHFNLNQLAYDAYVAAYHDQGLIPFKMVAGLSAVNVTIGLPFLRTSVSHGTAPDIVGQGIADPASLIAAYETAIGLIISHATNSQQPPLATALHSV